MTFTKQNKSKSDGGLFIDNTFVAQDTASLTSGFVVSSSSQTMKELSSSSLYRRKSNSSLLEDQRSPSKGTLLTPAEKISLSQDSTEILAAYTSQSLPTPSTPLSPMHKAASSLLSTQSIETQTDIPIPSANFETASQNASVQNTSADASQVRLAPSFSVSHEKGTSFHPTTHSVEIQTLPQTSLISNGPQDTATLQNISTPSPMVTSTSQTLIAMASVEDVVTTPISSNPQDISTSPISLNPQDISTSPISPNPQDIPSSLLSHKPHITPTLSAPSVLLASPKATPPTTPPHQTPALTLNDKSTTSPLNPTPLNSPGKLQNTT